MPRRPEFPFAFAAFHAGTGLPGCVLHDPFLCEGAEARLTFAARAPGFPWAKGEFA